MAVKDIMELLDEHPELVDEALEILREYKKKGIALGPYSRCPLTIPPASCACARA